VVCVVQSYLRLSHNSLKSESLKLELTDTGHSGGSLSTGREEKINYMLSLSDDEADDVSVVLFPSKDIAKFYLSFSL